jgi:hypothetical protein
MRRLFSPALCIAVALAACSATSCLANDSSSELAAGGLVMVKTDAIAIQREDLTLALDQVQVRYEMRNDQAVPVTLRVAFPMPEVPIDTPGGMEIPGADGNPSAGMIEWPSGNAPNALFFRVSVDGNPVRPDIEVRADLPDGRNIAGALRQIGGWWLVLNPKMYIDSPAPDSFDPGRDIGPTMMRQLRDLGAVEGDDPIWPLWRTRITFHWMQTFKPGVTIVEHRYFPIIGHFYLTEKAGQWTGWERTGPERSERDYCIGDAERHALRELAEPGGVTDLSVASLGYILTTGANWAGPIGTFHVAIEGDRGPTRLGRVGTIVLCSETPLERTGPLRLEGTARDFVPTRDLKVLMVMRP